MWQTTNTATILRIILARFNSPWPPRPPPPWTENLKVPFSEYFAWISKEILYFFHYETLNIYSRKPSKWKDKIWKVPNRGGWGVQIEVWILIELLFFLLWRLPLLLFLLKFKMMPWQVAIYRIRPLGETLRERVTKQHSRSSSNHKEDSPLAQKKTKPEVLTLLYFYIT